MRQPVLSIEALSVTLPSDSDRRFAVQDVSLDLARGEILCIVGESGSGKSVLTSAIMGALPDGLALSGGRILFEGRDISRLPEAAMRRLRGASIAMIFQEPMSALNPALTVADQIEEVFELHRPAMPREERRRRVLALLHDVRLPDPETLSRRLPHQLSGGQCQRIVIAMALALDPVLLIADEPTTALDVTTQAQILRLMRELRDEHGHAILFITHDLGVVADIADNVVVMRQGRMVEQGPMLQVLTDPRDPYTKMLVETLPGTVPKHDLPPRAYPAVSVRNVVKHYGRNRALDDISFDLARGSTLAIVGESGCGKSTLARAVIRLAEVDSGQVVIDGVDFATLSGRRLRQMRRTVQMVFQDPYGALNPRRNVGKILRRAGRLSGLSAADARAQALALIDMVGLPPEALLRGVDAFSGGQRQRVGIARALAMRPGVIIADEIVAALDMSMQAQILDLLARLKRDAGLTLLFITHDLRVAAEIADTVAVMHKGRIVEIGPASKVFASPVHDYTRQLLAAIPGQALRGAARSAIVAHQPASW